MSDFNFHTSVSRDDVTDALTYNTEQAAYVFAGFADRTNGTSDGDDFLDHIDNLAPHHKDALTALCQQVLERLEAEFAA